MSIRFPPSRQPIAGGFVIDPNWERWFGDLAREVNTAGSSTPAPPVEIPSFVVSGAGSVTADGSVAGGEFVVTLVGDADNPLPGSLYGVDSTGNKGFVPLYDGLEEGQGIALRDSGYIIVDTVATPGDLPATGNAGEAVRVTESEVGIYAWDGSAFTLDAAATGVVSIACDATAEEIPYDNTDSGLAATDVQAAIDEVAAGVSAMFLVGTATVLGSAATTLAMSGLDLAAHGRYIIEVSLKNATASDSAISMFYNADTTATNYDTQFVTGNASGITAARSNAAAIFTIDASTCLISDIRLRRDLNGIARAHLNTHRGAPAALILQSCAHAWATAANVTAITFSSSVANALAVGSYFKVWRLT